MRRLHITTLLALLLLIPSAPQAGEIDEAALGPAELATVVPPLEDPLAVTGPAEFAAVTDLVTATDDAATDSFDIPRADSGYRSDVGPNFYTPSDFEQGLIFRRGNVAMKIGGYVKADLIHDFDAIDSTDVFDVTTIPTSGPERTNTRFHARQTRLNLDARWRTDRRVLRAFIEGDFFGDFFGESDRFRLRHAYGESGRLTVGQTWTTFTDVTSSPATLDFEGSVSSVDRRQALVRWTQPAIVDGLTVAVALEQPSTIIEVPEGVEGEARTPTPDLVANVRYSREWGQFQIAGVTRELGFQPTGRPVETGPAWGLNFTGAILLDERNEVYSQIVFGSGIGSFRGLPDVVPTRSGDVELLGIFGWMVGVTHEWTEDLSSNFTFAYNYLSTDDVRAPEDLESTTYLAVNLIWSPLERVDMGIEYLYGVRNDFGGSLGTARRIQAAFIFYLP